MNDLDIDLDRNTPWVDMSACVKFGLDRPSRLAGHMERRYKHNAFYYIDYQCVNPPSLSLSSLRLIGPLFPSYSSLAAEAGLFTGLPYALPVTQPTASVH